MAPPPNVIIHEDRAQPQIQPQIIQPQLQYRDLLISNNDTLNSRKRYQFIDPLDEYLKETRSTKKKILKQRKSLINQNLKKRL